MIIIRSVLTKAKAKKQFIFQYMSDGIWGPTSDWQVTAKDGKELFLALEHWFRGEHTGRYNGSCPVCRDMRREKRNSRQRKDEVK